MCVVVGEMACPLESDPLFLACDSLLLNLVRASLGKFMPGLRPVVEEVKGVRDRSRLNEEMSL